MLSTTCLQSRRTPLAARSCRSLILAALCVGPFSPASAQVIIGSPLEVHTVQELNSTGGTIQNIDHELSVKGWPDQHRIDLGDPPHRSALGPTFAEAYSHFDPDTTTTTYWTAVNAYPGRVNDNGRGVAQVELTYAVHKDRPDATFVLDITGGRLQLVDSLGIAPLDARVDLHATVESSDGVFYRFDAFASLDGHGGRPAAATFFPDWEGFTIASSNYTEQRVNDNVVGATLDIPAQQIPLDLSNVFDDVDFLVYVRLSVEARALYPDGTAAMAFLRDPTHLDAADPLLGSPGITFSGLTLLAPVPEPSSWALLAAGLASLGVLGLRRRRSSHSPSSAAKRL